MNENIGFDLQSHFTYQYGAVKSFEVAFDEKKPQK
jgi:hypothetical protein